MAFNWLRDTTQSYRMGWVDGERGWDLLLPTATDASEYARGVADAQAKGLIDDLRYGDDEHESKGVMM
jgi:hypothetical protein